MKVGDIVVCINCSGFNLTLGKRYTILVIISLPLGYYIRIANDDNIKGWYNPNRFITLQEWREKKLNDMFDDK